MAQQRTRYPRAESVRGETGQGAEAHLAPEHGNNHEQPAEAGADHAAMQRAEEMVDRIAERIGHYAQVFGHEVLRLGARAREEAEDIWAEAQHIRQRSKTSP
jgi:hypothetical protein